MLFGCLLAPRPILVLALPNFGSHKYQRRGSVRVSRCEQHRQRTTFRASNHSRRITSNVVHHRPDIVHPHIETRSTRNTIRHPHPTLVKHNHSTKLAEPFTKTTKRRELPIDLEMGPGTHHIHYVDRAIPNHVIRNINVAAICKLNIEHQTTVPNPPSPKDFGRFITALFGCQGGLRARWCDLGCYRGDAGWRRVRGGPGWAVDRRG